MPCVSSQWSFFFAHLSHHFIFSCVCVFCCFVYPDHTQKLHSNHVQAMFCPLFCYYLQFHYILRIFLHNIYMRTSVLYIYIYIFGIDARFSCHWLFCFVRIFFYIVYLSGYLFSYSVLPSLFSSFFFPLVLHANLFEQASSSISNTMIHFQSLASWWFFTALFSLLFLPFFNDTNNFWLLLLLLLLFLLLMLLLLLMVFSLSLTFCCPHTATV